MSALVIPLIALLDRKWPVSLCSFPGLKRLYNYRVDWTGTQNVWRRHAGLARLTFENKCCCGVSLECDKGHVTTFCCLVLVLFATDHILVCTCIVNFNCLVWLPLSPWILVVRREDWAHARLHEAQRWTKSVKIIIMIQWHSCVRLRFRKWRLH